MDSESQNRELTTSELETVSGGRMATLDFGIVEIYLLFPGADAGPMTGASICGSNGCVSQMFGP